MIRARSDSGTWCGSMRLREQLEPAADEPVAVRDGNLRRSKSSRSASRFDHSSSVAARRCSVSSVASTFASHQATFLARATGSRRGLGFLDERPGVPHAASGRRSLGPRIPASGQLVIFPGNQPHQPTWR